MNGIYPSRRVNQAYCATEVSTFVNETTNQPQVILANASLKDSHPYYDATLTALEVLSLYDPGHTILQRAYSNVYAYLIVLG
jgi:hypothetical protein